MTEKTHDNDGDGLESRAKFLRKRHFCDDVHTKVVKAPKREKPDAATEGVETK